MCDQVYTARFRRKFGVEDELNRYVSRPLRDTGSGARRGRNRRPTGGEGQRVEADGLGGLPDRLCGLRGPGPRTRPSSAQRRAPQQRKAISEIEEAMAERPSRSATPRTRSSGCGASTRRSAHVRAVRQSISSSKPYPANGGPETTRPPEPVTRSSRCSLTVVFGCARALLRSSVRRRCATSSARRPRFARCSPSFSSSPDPHTRFSTGRRASVRRTVARLVLEVASRDHNTPFPSSAPSSKLEKPTTTCAGICGGDQSALSNVDDPIYQGSKR